MRETAFSSNVRSQCWTHELELKWVCLGDVLVPLNHLLTVQATPSLFNVSVNRIKNNEEYVRCFTSGLSSQVTAVSSWTPEIVLPMTCDMLVTCDFFT
jgi:hypothetical protein